MGRKVPILAVVALAGITLGLPSSARANDPLPRVPLGFVVHPYAVIPGAPTGIAFGPDGTMYVSDLVGGQVIAIDASGPVGGTQTTFGTGFSSPLGVVVDGQGRVFVADAETARPGPFGTRAYGRVWRLQDTNDDGVSDVKQLVLKDLPNGRHNTNGLAFGPDGMLYVANGNSTDDGTEGGEPEVDPWSGSVVRVDPNATDVSLADLTERDALVAEGMRNLYDLTFSPLDPSKLFIPMNGLDDARSDAETADDPAGLALEDSDDLLFLTDVDDVTEVVDLVTGLVTSEPIVDDFGFPQCLYNVSKKGNLEPFDNPNPTTQQNFGTCSPGVPRPVASFGLHVSANGLAFQNTDAWGADFRNDLFVTEFGNFFGPDVAGHKVMRVELDAAGERVVRQSEFMSGPVPLDVTFGPDGSMYVADVGGTIYKVSHVAAVPSVTVTMAAFQFVPQALSVPEGTVIRFSNADPVGAPHNAVGQMSIGLNGPGDGHEIQTDTFGPGAYNDIRIDEPGLYTYLCTVHPTQMRGTITVVPAGS